MWKKHSKTVDFRHDFGAIWKFRRKVGNKFHSGWILKRGYDMWDIVWGDKPNYQSIHRSLRSPLKTVNSYGK